MYRDARDKVGIGREDAAWQLHIGSRTLANYELGQTVPPPDVVLAMSQIYEMPEITQKYCRKSCPIGQAYSFEVLNAIDTGLSAVVLKLVTELKEAQQMLGRLVEVTVNKTNRSDFTKEEWTDFCQALQELFDVEHNIEILKITLGKITDVSELIKEHNQKCWKRGYARKEKELLKAAR